MVFGAKPLDVSQFGNPGLAKYNALGYLNRVLSEYMGEERINSEDAERSDNSKNTEGVWNTL